MRRKIASGLIYTASALIAIGGLGDQFIQHLLDVHCDYLGNRCRFKGSGVPSCILFWIG